MGMRVSDLEGSGAILGYTENWEVNQDAKYEENVT
jgi:hypothetical protein